MFRSYRRTTLLSIFCAALAAGACGVQAQVRTIRVLAPTPNQIVRESVRITVPGSSVPEGFAVGKGELAPEKGRPYVSVSLKQGDTEQFVDALSADACVNKSGHISFYWSSKAPFKDRKTGEDRYFKDGSYVLEIAVHDKDGTVTDSASVPVQLKNKIARPNPAPAVSLSYRLGFGQVNVFSVRADAQVFELVNNVPLPLMGGLGITSNFKVIQSVEDVTGRTSALLRCRVAKFANVDQFGQQAILYDSDESAPQLYRLVSLHGKVIKANVFSRQGKNTITDILPVLPSRSVREGDSWPSSIVLKVEGVTGLMTFSGTSMLDSFEWQDGMQCVKILSRMTGKPSITMAAGKIRSQGSNVNAFMTTYIAPGSGRFVRNEITLEFPAMILPGAGEASPSESQPIVGVTSTGGPGGDINEPDAVFQTTPNAPGTPGTQNLGAPAGTKKGSVVIKMIVRREK